MLSERKAFRTVDWGRPSSAAMPRTLATASPRPGPTLPVGVSTTSRPGTGEPLSMLLRLHGHRRVAHRRLAFDRGGGRTGWGMGHYDATLVHAPHALYIGI